MSAQSSQNQIKKIQNDKTITKTNKLYDTENRLIDWQLPQCDLTTMTTTSTRDGHDKEEHVPTPTDKGRKAQRWLSSRTIVRSHAYRNSNWRRTGTSRNDHTCHKAMVHRTTTRYRNNGLNTKTIKRNQLPVMTRLKSMTATQRSTDWWKLPESSASVARSRGPIARPGVANTSRAWTTFVRTNMLDAIFKFQNLKSVFFSNI